MGSDRRWGDAQGFVVNQLRRSVGGVQQFAAFAFGEKLQTVEALHSPARSLVDIELDASDQFVEVVVAVAAATTLAELVTTYSIAAQAPALHENTTGLVA